MTQTNLSDYQCTPITDGGSTSTTTSTKTLQTPADAFDSLADRVDKHDELHLDTRTSQYLKYHIHHTGSETDSLEQFHTAFKTTLDSALVPQFDITMFEKLRACDSDHQWESTQVIVIFRPSVPSDTSRSTRVSHPDLADVDASGMAFITPEDGLEFPHPDAILSLRDDASVDSVSTTDLSRVADPENGVFLAMDSESVYEYLETQQKKTDWWLMQELKSLKRQHLSQKSARLSNPDKQWIVRWEQKRRAEEQGEWNPTPDSHGWQDLPNA